MAKDRSTATYTNSLVGSQAGDQVGLGGLEPLSNGNYVVKSSQWANGGNAQAGAVTWGNGTTGITAVVSTTNSLVGSQPGDQVSYDGVTVLGNGNYVVSSSRWANGGNTLAGAVTWGNGTTGITGVVSTTNSLVGDQAGDFVGIFGDIRTPTFSSYVVSSPLWHSRRGAVTWGNGATGVVGLISSANSFIGGQPNDYVGFGGFLVGFRNGSYVISSRLWANGPITQTGAVTWGNGNTGTTGVVSSTNSLVGTQSGDMVSNNGLTSRLSDDSYVVVSRNWANGGNANAGAVSLLPGAGPSSGPINTGNSVLGSAANGGVGLNWVFDCVNKQLVVGRPADNIVTLFIGAASCRYTLDLPIVVR